MPPTTFLGEPETTIDFLVFLIALSRRRSSTHRNQVIEPTKGLADLDDFFLTTKMTHEQKWPEILATWRF